MSFLQVQIFPSLIDNYVFLIWDPDSHEAGLIDPAEGTANFQMGPSPTTRRIIEFIVSRQLSLKWIFNTHHHFDHVGGIIEIHSYYAQQTQRPIPIFHSTRNQFFQNRLPQLQDSVPVQEGDVVSLGEYNFEILELPGHTLDHITLHHKNLLFCGDTLFSLGCGRIFDGSASLLFRSLQKIKALPPATLVYCSHEFTLKNGEFCLQYEPTNQDLRDRILEAKIQRQRNLPTIPSPLSMELKTNVFLRCHLPHLRRSLGLELHASDEEVFTELRKRKDTF